LLLFRTAWYEKITVEMAPFGMVLWLYPLTGSNLRLPEISC
jgi:hypothetical protein